jgi:hypothetical protein
MICGHNSLQKPTGEQWIGPRKTRGSVETPLSITSRRQTPNDEKFYWQGTNQSLTLTNFLAPARLAKQSRIPSLPIFLLGMILSRE